MNQPKCLPRITPITLVALLAGAFAILFLVLPQDAQATGTGDWATAVAGGGTHTCVLKSKGNVDCYGNNSYGYGQTADYTVGDAIAVAAGSEHTCVLKSNGNVDCYGYNGFGQAADYLGGDATAVSTGYDHTCVLKSNGNVDCYGYNGYGQAADYLGGDATAVAAGYRHTCVLKSNGNVECYGSNYELQAQDYLDGDAIAVAAGADHTCVLKSNGNVDCYGNLLGFDEAEDYLGGDAIAVATGADHTCVLKSNGNVDCYGNNYYGQAADYIVPSAPSSLTATTGPAIGQISLSWQAASSNGGSAITSYKVYRGTSSGSETLLSSGGCSGLGNVFSCTDSNLGNGATRYYKVSAVSANGEGQQSNEASATTYNIPSAPQNLQVGCATPAGVQLTWAAPSSNGGASVTGYKIYRSSDGITFTPIASPSASPYSDLPPWRTAAYFYQVVAINFVGEGTAAATSFAPCDPQAPTTPLVSSLTHPDQTKWYSAQTSSVSWSSTDAYSNVAGYYYTAPATGSCAASLTGGTWTTGTSASFSGLGPFGAYRFCVQAKDNAGNLSPVTGYAINVDNVAPTFFARQPLPGTTTHELRAPVRVNYEDTDGGADPTLPVSKTTVDPATVQFVIDGTDQTARWRPVCTAATIPGCPLELDSGHVQYTPPNPWTDGAHTAFAQAQDTVVGPNVASTSWGFTKSNLVTTCSPPTTVGAQVDGVGGACVPTPVLCEPPTLGTEPTCHTVTQCTTNGQVGVQLDGNSTTCVTLPVLCQAPSMGVQPSCHTVTECPNGQTGVSVDGSTSSCVPTPVLCPTPSVGVQPICHTATVCSDPTTVGVQIDGTGPCQPIPVLCPVPSVGVEPQCFTLATCNPPSTVGATVNGQGTCQPNPCVNPVGTPPGALVTVCGIPICSDPLVMTTPDLKACGSLLCTGGVSTNGVCTHTLTLCEPPSVGAGVDDPPTCHTAAACSNPNQIGVQLDGTGPCLDKPVLCDLPSIGVVPDCHTATVCTSGFGVQVDGSNTCQANPCPEPLDSAPGALAVVCGIPLPNPCPQGANATGPVQACGNTVCTGPPVSTGPLTVCGTLVPNPCPTPIDSAPGALLVVCGVPIPDPCLQGVNLTGERQVCGIPVCPQGVDPATVGACGTVLCPMGVTTAPNGTQVATVCGQPVSNPCPQGANATEPTQACGILVCEGPPVSVSPLAVCGTPLPDPCPTPIAFAPGALIVVCGTPIPDLCPSGVTSSPGPGQMAVVCGQGIPNLMVGVMPECLDGFDNDGDGKTDFGPMALGGGDAQCTNPFDNNETN